MTLCNGRQMIAGALLDLEERVLHGRSAHSESRGPKKVRSDLRYLESRG